MQKFTRNLTREVEIGGERLAVTFSAEGVSLRPVGSRRPPRNLSWGALLCAAAGHSDGTEPPAEAVAQALDRLKNPPKQKAKADESNEASPSEETPGADAPGSPSPGANAPGSPSPGADAPGSPSPGADAPGSPSPGADAPGSPSPGAARPGSPGRLTDLLARVERWIQQHRPRFARALLPGATAEQVDAAQQQLGRAFPEEVRELLSWHNGQDPDVIGTFEGPFFLMSADQIAEVVADLEAQPPEGWHKGWLPFLDDDSDDYLVLDPQPAGGVREVCAGEPTIRWLRLR